MRPMGMDQNRRETLPVVGNLDRLQLRHCRLAGGVAKAIDPPFEAREALIGFGMKEALANVIIVSRAKEVGSRALRMRLRRRAGLAGAPERVSFRDRHGRPGIVTAA